MQYYKSLHVFIESAVKIINVVPDAKFVIAGYGEARSKLVKLTEKLKLTKKIQFLGRVSENEKIALLQKAWVFINPSLMEGWGITTIEANACGTPAIASDVPGLRDSINNPHTGILVKYGDSDAFAKQTIKVIKNKKDREKMSTSAIEWVKKYSWEISSEKLYSIMFKAVINDSLYANEEQGDFIKA